jgi:phosphohistidine phosphatase
MQDALMRTLILFRHAKSSWTNAGLGDFDRPLSARGEKAAPKMAAYIAEQELVPDLVLCSAARRARDTLHLALPSWTPEPRIDFVKALYLAEMPTLLALIHDTPEEARRLMIIGHNPGLQNFALVLIGADAPEARPIARKFPTAAVAVIRFDIADWAAVRPGCGRLGSFTTPKQLGMA